MAHNMSVGEHVLLKAEGRNDLGEPAQLTAPPNWSAAPPGIVTMRVAPNGAQADVTAAAVGNTTITVSSDPATPGTFDIAVLPGTATQIAISQVTP